MPRRHHGLPGRDRAFTLIEMLVVIGIITVLVGILVPVINKAQKAGDRGRTQVDLQSISTAVEAFKGDTNDYPRPNTFPAVGNGAQLIAANEVLGACLIGSADLQKTNPDTSPGQPATVPIDGHTGPGFRYQGKVCGPYLDPGKFKLANGSNALMDRNGIPILYFPRRAMPQNPPPTMQPLDPTLANGYVADITDPAYAGYKSGVIVPMYNHAMAAVASGPTLNITDMRYLLGDRNANGQIDGTETPAFTGSYILWFAGPDRKFGADPKLLSFTWPTSPSSLSPSQLAELQNAMNKCDDVTNFRP